jgi:acyl-CoA synthetase (AMP-forming)/AMP-acid ligase II
MINLRLIISGGENIYPLEIEERLLQHNAINRAIVVGVKHSRYGEVVAAFLQRAESFQSHHTPSLSDEDIREWVRMTLGRHKAPAHVFWLGEGTIPASIPLTGSGKVRKFELAKLAEQVLITHKAKL